MIGQTQAGTVPAKRVRKRLPKAQDCCNEATLHPDHGATLGRLRRIQGQIAGIERMILERRYCADILVQCRAAESALKSVEGAILETHLRDCVRKAIESKNKSESEKKIGELMDLFSRS